MKKIIAAAALAITATAVHAGNTVIEEKTMRSYDMCVLQAGFTISSLRDGGARLTKIVDSTADQMFVYKAETNGRTGFVSCTGRKFKVWIMN